MKPFLRHVLVSARLLVCFAFLPGALHAQAPTKIFVASYGNDANDGSRGSPKRNFQAAHNAVAASGQIVVLDTAGYGALNITKSIDITVPPGVNGFVTVPFNTVTAININAGFSDSVTLRGLIVEGGANKTTASPNTNYGIFVPSVGVLTVENCVIRNFYDGLYFVPNTSGGSHINVLNTKVTNCRYGIDVETPNAFFVAGLIAGCYIVDNGAGVFTGGAGTTFVVVKDCFLANNSPAISCVDNANVVVSNCTLTNNNPVTTKPAGTNTKVYTAGNNTLFLNFGSSDFTDTLTLR